MDAVVDNFGAFGLVEEEADGRPTPRSAGRGEAGPFGREGDENDSTGIETRRSQGLERFVVGRDPGFEGEKRAAEGVLHVVPAEALVLAGCTEAPGTRAEGGEHLAYVQETEDAGPASPPARAAPRRRSARGSPMGEAELALAIP